MANISIKELTDVIQKSGLPLGDSVGMQGATPFARDPITAVVRGGDTQVPQLRNKYMDTLKKVAEMDQRLSQVYGDPSSKLYIENPMNRERLKMGASKTGYSQVQDIGGEISRAEKDLESTIGEATSFYKQLASLQKSEEVAAKKASKVKTGRSSKSLKQLEKERKQLGLDITDKAHIYKDDARDYFLNTPVDFQNSILRDIYTNPELEHPKEGYSTSELKVWYEAWKKNTLKPTNKEIKSGSLTDKINSLKF